MDFRKMKYFMTVAEEQNFTRAAEKLYVAQSSLSEQIQRLEEELNCLLFVRSKRGAQLTDQGKIFYDYCSRALQEYASTLSLLHPEQKILRLGIYDNARIDEWIEKIEHHNACSDTQIQYSYLYSNEVVQKLKRSDLDMGLSFANSELEQMGFRAVPVYSIRLGIYAKTDTPLSDVRLFLAADNSHSKESAEASRLLLEKVTRGKGQPVLVSTLEEMLFKLRESYTAAAVFDYVALENHLAKIAEPEIDMPLFWYSRSAGPAVDWVCTNLN